MDKYEIDRDLLGNCWIGNKMAFEIFCDMLQDAIPDARIIPLWDTKRNINNGIPAKIWCEVTNDHGDLYPEAWDV